MSRVAVLFPGQGEQQVGMLHRLPAAGSAVLRAAGAVLGEDPLNLDDAQHLATTTGTQLALLLTAVAWFDEALARGLEPSYLCGHSVGLWSAAVCAGVLDLHDAIRLVRLRGEAMHAASGPDDGMLAVTGLTEQMLEDLTLAAREAGLDVWVSVVNATNQVVVSGTAAGLGRVQQLAERRGAQQVTRLAVAVAAHCPLMTPAAIRLRGELDSVSLATPTVPIAGNTTARLLRTAQQVRSELWRGVDTPVRWADTTATMSERGVAAWLQLPPGSALARLAGQLADLTLSVENLGLDAALRRIRLV